MIDPGVVKTRLHLSQTLASTGLSFIASEFYNGGLRGNL
jgi:hypothetical protein